MNGDGCSADCITETGFKCVQHTPTSISTCYPICSDGIVTGSETCDDENTMSGDGCDANCQIETNWTCSGSPSICVMDCPIGMEYNNYTYS